MCRRLTYLIAFFLILNVAGNASANLVAHWNFDDGSGSTAQDSSGNGNHGTLFGNPQWITGHLGGALDFDGNGDYVDLPISSLLSSLTNSTFATWVDFSNAGGGWQRIFDFGIDTTYNMFLTPRMDTAGVMRFAITISGYTDEDQTTAPSTLPSGWHHVAVTLDADNNIHSLYLDGELVAENTTARYTPSSLGETTQNWLGRSQYSADGYFDGSLDDFRIYNRILTAGQVEDLYNDNPPTFTQAFDPNPQDGAIHPDIWVTLSWKPGDFAASHDIYISDNFDDINDGTGDTFRGNQDSVFYVAGFPGFAYEEGLVNGTTYYWRIDEVNGSHPDSPWKGPVWSFTVPPKTAYAPEPTDGTEFIDLNVVLSWTPGFGAKLHFIILGEDFDEVNNAAMGVPTGPASYSPGPLKLAKTYYWRVDESDGFETYKGDIWSFTTEGAVSGPNPTDSAVDVKPSVVLKWDAGAVAASHEVYFGMDADAVKNATTTSPEYKGPKALGEESYDPSKLTLNTAYFWRIDEVNGASTDSPWAGNVWSFTTGDFFVIDDFEDYDTGDNQIWFVWHDGLGAGAPGAPDYIPGNGTGSAVGDETTASYTEETIVNGGLQSMPLSYDNNKQGFSKYSEVEYTLTDQRDWTEEGVVNLSLWFRGNPASVGSFVEGPVGTYTMTGSGADIWNESDEFHYAYKTLTGTGSIIAKVESVGDTDPWAKAGVMIRETLNADSKHAMMVVSSASGVSFQRRPETGGASADDTTTDIAAPYWVKIERDLAGNFSAYSSADGSSWQKVGLAEPIQMGTNVYIGLAVTAHSAGATCEAIFTNVTTTGSVGPQWANQDIGIASNEAEPLYVVVSNSSGATAVVVHDDPEASLINEWTQWIIPLQALADQGITLTNVDEIAIGLGSQGNMTIPGGKGKIYIDDVRLLTPATEPAPQP
ncbi:LamG-like jellyroll fold domain-containing protein [Planctomycetota bacterium]